MENLELINKKINEYKNKSIHAVSIYNNRSEDKASKHVITSIADNSEIGSVAFDDIDMLLKNIDSNCSSDWKNISVKNRADILINISNRN